MSQVAKYDTTPAVTMACAGVYDEVAKNGSVNMVCGTILPVMLPMLMNSKIGLQQFRTLQAIVRSQLSRIESTRIAELGESDKLQQQVESFN